MKETAEKMDTAVEVVDFTDMKEAAKTAARKVAEYKKAYEQEYRNATRSPESAAASKYTVDYALEQLEKVREASSKFAEDVGRRVNGFDSRNECDPDEDGNSTQSRAADALVNAADALANLVVLQMGVYDKMTDFYIRMISDLMANSNR